MYETKFFVTEAEGKDKIDNWLNGRGKAFDVVGYLIEPGGFNTSGDLVTDSYIWITIKYK